jgi:hypothetical protein
MLGDNREHGMKPDCVLERVERMVLVHVPLSNCFVRKTKIA